MSSNEGIAPVSTRGCNRMSSSTLHRLPCQIEYDGPANVDVFFVTEKDAPSSSTNTACTGMFRGRKLRGEAVPVPPGYVGVVFQTDGRSSYRICRKFDKVTYWNHDTLPSASDDIPTQLDWIQMASCIHDESAFNNK